MLSTSPAKTLEVVCGVKPEISSDTYNLYDEDLVDKLINGMGGLSSIYHKTHTEWSKEQAKYNKKDDDDTLPAIERIPKKREEKTQKPVPVPKQLEKVESESSDEPDPKVNK